MKFRQHITNIGVTLVIIIVGALIGALALFSDLMQRWDRRKQRRGHARGT